MTPWKPTPAIFSSSSLLLPLLYVSLASLLAGPSDPVSLEPLGNRNLRPKSAFSPTSLQLSHESKKKNTVYDAKKKGQLIFVQKKNHWSGRVVECLFLSTAGPKRGCSSNLIVIIGKQTSDVWIFALISIRYDKHPLFGPAVDRNKPSTTRPDQCFFLDSFSCFVS